MQSKKSPILKLPRFFHPRIGMKNGGDFKTGIFLDFRESFLYCHSSTSKVDLPNRMSHILDFCIYCCCSCSSKTCSLYRHLESWLNKSNSLNRAVTKVTLTQKLHIFPPGTRGKEILERLGYARFLL